jgi:hypothetical protein
VTSDVTRHTTRQSSRQRHTSRLVSQRYIIIIIIIIIITRPGVTTAGTGGRANAMRGRGEGGRRRGDLLDGDHKSYLGPIFG